MNKEKLLEGLSCVRTALAVLPILPKIKLLDILESLTNIVNVSIVYISRQPDLPVIEPGEHFLILEKKKNGGWNIEKYSRKHFLPTPVSTISASLRQFEWIRTAERIPSAQDGCKQPGRFEGDVICRDVEGEMDILPWEVVATHSNHFISWRRLIP